MSRTNTIKNEILTTKIASDCCHYAFLSGVIRGCGVLDIGKDGFGVTVACENKKVIEKVAIITSYLFNFESIIELAEHKSMRSVSNYAISIPPNIAKGLLLNTQITLSDYELSNNLPINMLKNECCKSWYIKGLFCGCGSVSLPHLEVDSDVSLATSLRYHLELSLTQKEIAEQMLKMLNDLEFNFKQGMRKSFNILYLKNSENISDFLAYLGASNAVMDLQAVLTSRYVRNIANRQTNCIMANMNKIINASAKYIAAIELISKSIGLNNLEQPLRVVAEARINEPSSTTESLAQSLGISKSALVHRLRRILQISQDI